MLHNYKRDLPEVCFDMDGTTMDFPQKLRDLIVSNTHPDVPTHLQKQHTWLYNELLKRKQLPEYVRQHLADLNNWKEIKLGNLFDVDQKEKDRISDIIHGLYQNENFFASLEPYPGMVELIHSLKDICYVTFCTKPSENPFGSEAVKRSSIIKYFWEEYSMRITQTFDKTNVRAALLIDDAPDFSKGRYIPEWQHIIVDAAHNRHIEGQPRVYIDKVDQWKNVIIHELKKIKEIDSIVWHDNHDLSEIEHPRDVTTRQD